MSNGQRDHFNVIHDKYEDHYYDAESFKYRKRFIYRPIFDSMNRPGMKIPEIGCRFGHSAEFLRRMFPDAPIHGCDISDRALESYREKFGHDTCFHLDITKPNAQLVGRYDLIVAVSVVHHLVKNLEQFFINIDSLLNAGGSFIMYEPNALFMNRAREIWYRLDSNFDDINEEALDYEMLRQQYLPIGFTEERIVYIGGPAFYVILNSMILRVPKWFKRLAHKFWFVMEPYWNRLLPISMKACFFAE